MENTWFFILNPTSGGGIAHSTWRRIEAELKIKKITFELYQTESAGHGSEIAKNLIAAGARKIIAVGGDGTLHEVVNGILSQKEVPSTEIQVGLIPAGTGSDWARMYGISNQPRKRVAQLLQNQTQLQDAGLIQSATETRYWVNVAGLAYDSFVVEKTLNFSKKGFLGKIIYKWGVLRHLFAYPSAFIRLNSDTFQAEGQFFCINIGICRYSGGGMQTVPRSIPNDGLFDVTLIPKLSALALLKNLPRLLLGTIYGEKRVQFHRCTELNIEGEGKIEADGELVSTLPVQVKILPQVLKIWL